MSMTNPPIYTSWRNLERGQHLAVAGVFDDIHMTNAEAILSLQLENSKLRQRLTAADERVDVLEGLLDEFEAMQVCDARIRGGMPDRWQELIVRKRAALNPADDCEHSYHHFGTEQPRRRCNLCNKLEPVEGGDGGDECHHGYSNKTGCPVCQGIKP